MDTIKLAFIDVETTGVGESTGLIEITCIVDFWQNNEIIRHEEGTLKMSPFPNDEYEEESMNLLGYTPDELMSWPEPTEQYQIMVSLFDELVDKYNKSDKMFFIGYNSYFDLDHLDRFFKKNGNEYLRSYFWWPVIDVAGLVQQDVMQERDIFPDLKLQNVCKYYKIRRTKLHDSKDDILATRDIYYRITKKQ